MPNAAVPPYTIAPYAPVQDWQIWPISEVYGAPYAYVGAVPHEAQNTMFWSDQECVIRLVSKALIQRHVQQLTSGIPVANAAGMNAIAVAEHVVMMALYLLKNTHYAHRETSRGNWVMKDIINTPVLQSWELTGKTLGIIGCGTIGCELAKMVKAFNTNTLYYNRRPLPKKIEEDISANYAPLDKILTESDVVSVNVPLTEETRGMIGVDQIARMKKGAVLINTSRGGIVDEYAVAQALKEGRLKGAGFDVYSNEPITGDCPLLELENVLLTPHISGATAETVHRGCRLVAENVNRVLDGKPPLRVVN